MLWGGKRAQMLGLLFRTWRLGTRGHYMFALPAIGEAITGGKTYSCPDHIDGGVVNHEEEGNRISTVRRLVGSNWKTRPNESLLRDWYHTKWSSKGRTWVVNGQGRPSKNWKNIAQAKTKGKEYKNPTKLPKKN